MEENEYRELPCKDCGGTGEPQFLGSEFCDTCRGDGRGYCEICCRKGLPGRVVYYGLICKFCDREFPE